MHKVSDLDRFMDKVSIDDSSQCWIWVGASNILKYGRIYSRELRRAEPAHRFSWRLFRGALSDELDVLHKCDNPKCVNPEHLFLGNQSDNMKDMVSKGRALHRIGSTNPNSKLTEENVWWILQLYERRLFTQVELASLFNVTQSMISSILRGDSWSYMNGQSV